MLALLFDLDGTLFDTLDAIVDATNAALAEHGQPPLRIGVLRPLVGIPIDRQMEMLRGMTGARAEEIAESYYRHFVRRVEAGVPLYPAVRETFARFAGRRIGTMTTRRRDVARLMLEKAGIAGNFDAIVGGDEVGRPKPEPDLPRFAARSLGVGTGATVVVGDAPVDILAGHAAGAWTVAALYGYGDAREVRDAEPHAVIRGFPELPGVLQDLEERASRGSPRP
ncbi:MAG TPA: HAD family hydrolase [Thermoplasmata archaeon]|nr:HAD family hydrolase [Thermoplasmata archaeon]